MWVLWQNTPQTIWSPHGSSNELAALKLFCETASVQISAAVLDDAAEECRFENTLGFNLKLFRGGVHIRGWEKQQLWGVQVFTCVLVPAQADVRCRVRRGAVSPGKEQGGTFNSEKILTDAAREERRKENMNKPQKQGLLPSCLIIFGVTFGMGFLFLALVEPNVIISTRWWTLGNRRVLSRAYVSVTMIHSSGLCEQASRISTGQTDASKNKIQAPI